jgi:hypothetical protein
MAAQWWDYPTSFYNNVTGAVNDSVDGVADMFVTYPASIVPGIGIGMVVIMWLTFFILSYASGVKKAMAASSFITLILSTYLWRVGYVPLWILFTLIALLILGLIGAKDEQGL